MLSTRTTSDDAAGHDSADGAARAASAVPDNVPHYKSFDHITDPRVRRAKEYEQFLTFALDRFSADAELSPRIKQEIEWARAQSQRSKTSDRDLVFNAIEREELTRREIVEDTELPPATVYAHLRDLIGLGLVAERDVPGIGNNNKSRKVYSQTHGKV